MNWLQRAIALTILALWVPVAMHCTLETLPGFSFLQTCCGEESVPSHSSDCDTDFCSAIESGFYKIEDNPALTSGHLVLTTLATGTGGEAALPDPGPPLVGVVPSPPEISHSWQFHHRTALPPRAPSFAS